MYVVVGSAIILIYACREWQPCGVGFSFFPTPLVQLKGRGYALQDRWMEEWHWNSSYPPQKTTVPTLYYTTHFCLAGAVCGSLTLISSLEVEASDKKAYSQMFVCTVLPL